MDSSSELQKINRRIAHCRLCPLYRGHNPVPGEGDPHARLVFVGEAPGRTENDTGRPFSGRSGQLLDSLITGIGLERNQVYITNLVKHRPPANRQPKTSEISICSVYLHDQILAIKPSLIVTLGALALEKFTRKVYITKEHGSVTSGKLNGIEVEVFPTFHPAAAMRTPSVMKAIKNDFIKLKSYLDG